MTEDGQTDTKAIKTAVDQLSSGPAPGKVPARCTMAATATARTLATHALRGMLEKS